MFFFCSQLSIFASIILSLFILNDSFQFTFTPISPSNHSSPPLYISSLFHLFLYHFHPSHPICLLRLPFFFSSSHLLSPFRYFFPSSPFSSLIPAVSSLISLIMVSISLSISLLLLPSSRLLWDLSVSGTFSEWVRVLPAAFCFSPLTGMHIFRRNVKETSTMWCC
jgi:hypothetical protein